MMGYRFLELSDVTFSFSCDPNRAADDLGNFAYNYRIVMTRIVLFVSLRKISGLDNDGVNCITERFQQ